MSWSFLAKFHNDWIKIMDYFTVVLHQSLNHLFLKSQNENEFCLTGFSLQGGIMLFSAVNILCKFQPIKKMRQVANSKII